MRNMCKPLWDGFKSLGSGFASLCKGMSTVLDIAGTNFPSVRIPPIHQTDEEAWEQDRQALGRDWQQVNEDLQQAANRFKYHS